MCPSFHSLAVDVWLRGLRLKVRPLPNGLHSIRQRPDDRRQPCVSDIDSQWYIYSTFQAIL